MLNSDLVGFQTYSYSRHFISSASRLLNLEATPKGVDFNGKIIDVGVFPIGIDVERVQSIVKKVSIIEKTAKIRELYHGKLIIIGRDKLDHPRSVVHLLCAFERFLEDFPEWLSKVVLIQVTTPPQVKSKLVEKEISKHVQRINGRFGSLAFSPVHHYHHHLDEDEYFSLLQVANVGLITSLRDGMNSSCSEFVICQEHSHAPLILSEFTGTAGFLSSAMLVNPWDYQCVSRAINEALTMSKDEKRLKHQLLFDHVCRHTSQFWAKSFLSELEKKTSKKAAIDAKPLIPKLDSVLLCSLYNKSMRRLILLDYDGTLSPIAKTPNAAYPLPETIKAIKKLVSDPLNLVFIISGRDQACLDDWLGEINGLGLRYILIT